MSQSLGKEYIKFVSQNILGMLGISIYILADTFYISKAAGADGITVLNLCLPLYNLIYAIGSMVGVGSATRFTILKAQGDSGCHRFFSNAIFSVLFLSIPFMLAGALCPGQVLKIMGGDASITALGIPYARIFLIFAPCFMLNFIMNAFVRNDGAPSLAMAATLAGSIFNIIFDYIFMFPMGMGMAGAALATAVSSVVSSCVCGTHFFRKGNQIRFLWQRPSPKRLLQACQLGTSAFIGEFSSGVTTTTFNFLILGIAGNVGVAAYGVVANISLVAVALFNGIAQGSQPLVSESYGKGNTKDVKYVVGLAIKTALVLAVLIIAAIYIWSDPIASIFNSEKNMELAAYAREGIRLYFLGFLFAGINIVGTSALSAVEAVRWAFAASIMRGFVAILIFAFTLSAMFGMTGVWLAFPAAELVTMGLSIVGLKKSIK